MYFVHNKKWSKYFATTLMMLYLKYTLFKAIQIDIQVKSICLFSLYSLLESISRPNEIHFDPKISHHKQMEHIFLFTYTIRPFWFFMVTYKNRHCIYKYLPLEWWTHVILLFRANFVSKVRTVHGKVHLSPPISRRVIKHRQVARTKPKSLHI
jgi:hypothetical protein